MLKSLKKVIQSFKYWINYYPPELKEMQKNALESNRIYQSALDKVEKAPKTAVKRKPAVKKATTRSKTMATKPGLYANIHAKQERIKAGSGEKMRKPGSKDAPTAKEFKMAAKTVKGKK